MEINSQIVWVGKKVEKISGNRLKFRIDESVAVLESALKRGFNHWIIMFSGGKDSTATTVIALETALKKRSLVNRIDIVYSNTLVEIPVIEKYALDFLEFLEKFERTQGLPIFIHIARPALEERFWVCLLGKGYPPPHQRFRWCTRRLKIKPAMKALESYCNPNQTVVLTGVRFGESKSRNQRLNLSCRRGGECGQGVWFQYSSRLRVAYLAPIVYWQECDVWDFLNYLAPSWGYPTHFLESKIYNGRETRFGCWMCTVVQQDKTMMKITGLPEWSYLFPLLEFRNYVWKLTREPSTRIPKSNGAPGRLKISVREKLLNELLNIQEKLGIQLISKEEITFIHKLWVREGKADVEFR